MFLRITGESREGKTYYENSEQWHLAIHTNPPLKGFRSFLLASSYLQKKMKGEK
jgi:hypothetical protein